jgi:hypothetical protein
MARLSREAGNTDTPDAVAALERAARTMVAQAAEKPGVARRCMWMAHSAVDWADSRRCVSRGRCGRA